jgi:aspartate aminotransferase
MGVSFSTFATELRVETAFTVLALAQQEKARGKRIVELEIGDSPFPSTARAKLAGIEAIASNQTHYCPAFDKPRPIMRTRIMDSPSRPRTWWPGTGQKSLKCYSVRHF